MTLLMLLLALASAEEPDTAAPAEDVERFDEEMTIDANEEIIVFGELEVARQRAALEADLRDLGYSEAKTKDGRTVFRPEVAWHPTVVVYDEGFVVLKR